MQRVISFFQAYFLKNSPRSSEFLTARIQEVLIFNLFYLLLPLGVVFSKFLTILGLFGFTLSVTRIRSDIKGKTLIMLTIMISLSNIFLSVLDRDGDGLVVFQELVADMADNNPDYDRDLMKDGYESKNPDHMLSIIDPKNSDVDTNVVIDFCDLIKYQKLSVGEQVSVEKDIASRPAVIVMCEQVLNQTNNFEKCKNSKNKDENILFNFKCKDLVVAKIPDVIRNQYTPYYEN